MDNFDLKKFLVENRLTRNSILSELNEMAKPLKWTVEKLEQEAAKYNTPKEFQQADVNVYNIYRIAVRKGIIQDKFKNQNKDTSNYYNRSKWTEDALEQEAAKYDTPKEFQQSNLTAYIAYRNAINKGLIQNKFEEQFRWTKDALEQEAAKYTTAGEFRLANINAYSAYMRAAKKGLIQNKFKPTKDASPTSQSTSLSINYPNNNPYFGNPTTTFDKLKENKMDNFDLKRFLIENKMTRNSRLLNEQPEAEGIPADDPLAQIPAVSAETPIEPSGEVDVETAKELIFNTGGKFFTVTFIKKDGSERVMNARLGVKKYLRGGELKFNPSEMGLIPVYDMGAKGYRMVNTNTIKNLKIGKNEYVIPTAVSESEESQLDEYGFDFDRMSGSNNSQSVKASFEGKWNPVPKANKDVLDKSTGKDTQLVGVFGQSNHAIAKGSDGKFYRYEYRQASTPGTPKGPFDTVEKAKEGIK